jgi:hypothetical protein
VAAGGHVARLDLLLSRADQDPDKKKKEKKEKRIIINKCALFFP